HRAVRYLGGTARSARRSSTLSAVASAETNLLAASAPAYVGLWRSAMQVDAIRQIGFLASRYGAMDADRKDCPARSRWWTGWVGYEPTSARKRGAASGS